MSDLLNFLAENDISDITDEFEMVLKRKGKEEKHVFKIKAATETDFEVLRKRSTIKDKKGSVVDYDPNKLKILTCVECLIEPDFSSTDVIEKLGAITPDDALKKALLPGEIAELYTKISEISGFDRDINEDIKEAKN